MSGFFYFKLYNHLACEYPGGGLDARTFRSAARKVSLINFHQANDPKGRNRRDVPSRRGPSTGSRGSPVGGLQGADTKSATGSQVPLRANKVINLARQYSKYFLSSKNRSRRRNIARTSSFGAASYEGHYRGELFLYQPLLLLLFCTEKPSSTFGQCLQYFCFLFNMRFWESRKVD